MLRIGLALGAKPIPPIITAPKSVRISAKRFEATTTSNISGRQEIHRRGIDQIGDSSRCQDSLQRLREDLIPEDHAVFLGVGLGDRRHAFFLLRLRASSKAKRMTRSHPARVKIDV